MASSSPWTRQQLLAAFALYCRLPFGRLHRGNPEIIRIATAIGRSPSALAMKLTNIASLDPAITATGRAGLTGASAADREMWREMEADPDNFAVACQLALNEVEESIEEPAGDIPEADSRTLVETDRAVHTTARIGQNFFRSAVLSAYGGRCCITGLSIPALIVAGHIVPWSMDERNRLNPRNGLALSVLHERAFDAGLITINDDLTVRVSANPTARNDDFFTAAIERYDRTPIQLPRKFGVGKEFLAFHREHIFQG